MYYIKFEAKVLKKKQISNNYAFFLQKFSIFALLLLPLQRFLNVFS